MRAYPSTFADQHHSVEEETISGILAAEWKKFRQEGENTNTNNIIQYNVHYS